MRKGQIEILEKARENNFPENVIELLKSEVYTIKLLKEMYDFFFLPQTGSDRGCRRIFCGKGVFL